MLGIVLDTAHDLMGLTVISMTSDMAANIMRRKTLTKITRRVLVDLDHHLVRHRHRRHHVEDWVEADRHDVGDLDVLKCGIDGSD
jgi:hypothetical protein